MDLELRKVQTMESVIPGLVQSLHDRKDGPFVGVSELLLSYVAAYEHIPAQRRLDLFISLANKVGPGDHLFALIAILLDKYPSDRSVLLFATKLSSRYGVEMRLQVKIQAYSQADGSNDLQIVKQFLDMILDARKSKPTFSKSLLQLHDVDGAILNLLPFASVTLADVNLISKVSKKLRERGEDAAIICASYTDIFEDTVNLAEHYKDNEECQWLGEYVQTPLTLTRLQSLRHVCNC